MTINSAVILMCQSCSDGGYLFIITILVSFLHLLCNVMSCILQAMYYTSITFQTCYVNTLRTTFQLFSSYFVQI